MKGKQPNRGYCGHQQFWPMVPAFSKLLRESFWQNCSRGNFYFSEEKPRYGNCRSGAEQVD